MSSMAQVTAALHSAFFFLAAAVILFPLPCYVPCANSHLELSLSLIHSLRLESPAPRGGVEAERAGLVLTDEQVTGLAAPMPAHPHRAAGKAG